MLIFFLMPLIALMVWIMLILCITQPPRNLATYAKNSQNRKFFYIVGCKLLGRNQVCLQ